VEENHALAVMWYRRAAEQNHAAGQWNLGDSYAYGEGVDQDDALAVAWWEKAAKGGEEYAQYALGKCYMDGTRGHKHSVREDLHEGRRQTRRC
jgi:TPR repeat protein